MNDIHAFLLFHFQFIDTCNLKNAPFFKMRSTDTAIPNIQQEVMRDSETIEYLVRRIVEESAPLRVMIFGSSARGDSGKDSDIDILVVMPDGIHRRHTAQKLYRNIRDAKVPFDILVATPADLEKYKDNPGLIYHTIMLEGETVYAA